MTPSFQIEPQANGKASRYRDDGDASRASARPRALCALVKPFVNALPGSQRSQVHAVSISSARTRRFPC